MVQSPVVLMIDKPVGITSNDVLIKIKRSIPKPLKKTIKIGHLGTLDPFASGLLLVALGPACRFADMIHDQLPKTYDAKGCLGEYKLGLDVTGESVYCDWPTINYSDIEKRLERQKTLFEREYLQQIPNYSAAKHKGRALYSWARAGINIEKPAVMRIVHELKLQKFQSNMAEFTVRVSSGTYIRQLWLDWANFIGHSGFLHSLRRVQIGHLQVEEALPYTEIESCFNGQWPIKVGNELYRRSITDVLTLPKLNAANEEAYLRFLKGAKLKLEHNFRDATAAPGFYWFCWNGQNCGLGQVLDDAACYPRIVFPRQEIV